MLELDEDDPDRNAEERQRKGYKVHLHIYDMVTSLYLICCL